MKLLNIIILLSFLLFSQWGKGQALQMPDGVEEGQLSNGLTYYLIPDGDPGKVKVSVVTKVGTFIERPDQHGYAHMVEHMLFKGSENYPGNSCLEAMQLMGMRTAVDYNGFTGNKETEYFMTIPGNDKDYLVKSLRILKDWMFHLKIDEEILQNEKKVIVEEINRAGGDSEGTSNLIGTTLEGHSTLGTKESVLQATSNGLYKFYKDNYIPSNMAVIVYGQMDENFARNTIKKIFSHEPTDVGLDRNHYININDQSVISGKLSNRNENAPAELVILFKEKQLEVNNYVAFKERLSGQIMTEVLKKRLNFYLDKSVKNVSVNMGSVIQGNSSLIFRISLADSTNYAAVYGIFCKVLAQMQQQGVNKDEIVYEKELKMHYLNNRNNQSSNMYGKVKNLFVSGDIPLTREVFRDLTVKALEELNADDVNATFDRILKLDKTILFDSTSVACADVFDAAYIQDKFNGLNTIETEPFIFNSKVEISLQNVEKLNVEIKDISHAEILRKRTVNKDLHVLDYANGIKVVLYESEEDEASIQYIADMTKQGLSVDESDYFGKLLRYMTSSYGIYNDKEAREVEKSLSLTKNTSVDNGFYEMKIQGKSENMDQMIKILHLVMTDAHYPDATELVQKMDRFDRRKRNSDDALPRTDSAFVLNEEFVNRMYVTDQQIKANLNDAVILIKGDIPENIEDLVSTYIGSIKSQPYNSSLSPQSDSVIPDTAVYTDIVWKRDLARVVYYFKKESAKPFTMHDELVLKGANELAFLYMTNILRGKYGYVYASGKSAELNNYPFRYSNFRLAFMTDPSNIEKIYRIMYDEVLMHLDTIVLSDTEFEKSKAFLRSMYVMSFYENEQLMNEWLKAYLKYGKIYAPDELDAMIKALKKKDLQRCIQNVIDLERYERQTQLPKKQG